MAPKWAGRGSCLNTPTQYRACHYLPEAYPYIASQTPRTAWLSPDAFSWEAVRACLAPFGSSPVIVKDYVKSRKHEWTEACFMPDASDESTVRRVVGRFLELQGEDLQGGLVFREYRRLRRIGVHPLSGMPLSLEYRTFYLDGAPVVTVPYWEGVRYPEAEPPTDLVPGLDSRFYTVDRAMLETGDWLIMEVGDGQVSGLYQADALRRLHEVFATLNPR